MALTTAVYRKIEYRLGRIVPDTANDPDELPDDQRLVNGQVTISPIIPGGVLLFTAENPPVTEVVAEVVCDVVDSVLYYNGSPYLWLLTTDNELVNPVDWKWRITHRNLRVGGQPTAYPDFDFQVPSSTDTLHLTSATPLIVSGATLTLQGPPGAGVLTVVDNHDGTATVAAGTRGAGTGEVDTVNGLLPDVGGNVALTQDNIPSGTTAKQFTTAYRDKVDVIDASANLVTVWGTRPEVWHTGTAWPTDPRPIALPSGGTYNGPVIARSPSLPTVTSAPPWLRDEDIWEAAP